MNARSRTSSEALHHVVIVGGGFGGLYAAKSLRRSPVRITLIDRRNHHLFQPLLYQVATGGLSPANIAAPLRSVLERQRNASVLMGTVVDLDPSAACVRLSDGSTVDYDNLIIATGATHHYFGHDEWAAHAPGLKTIEDATRIRGRILGAFERAEREPDPARRQSLLTFVVVGAGPTGLELAGAVAEIARHTLRHEFRAIDPRESRVLLIDAVERVLPGYPEGLSARAQAQVERIGVQVLTRARVTAIDPEGLMLQRGTGDDDPGLRIAAHTVLWAAGVRASALAETVARRTGCATDRAGRLLVEPDCSLAGQPTIYAIGDLTNFSHGAAPLPGIAPVAMQQGRYVARRIVARLRGRALPPFAYKDRGQMATIGRAAAVADLRGRRLSGYLAWLCWLFVHLFFLIEFQNRVLVLIQWAWNYVTWNRSARLITGEHRE